MRRLATLLVLGAVACLAAGHVVFAFRHPCATDTQRLLYSWEAITFQRVQQESAP